MIAPSYRKLCYDVRCFTKNIIINLFCISVQVESISFTFLNVPLANIVIKSTLKLYYIHNVA